MGIIGRLNQYGSMLAGEFDDYSMSENLVLYSSQIGITPAYSAGGTVELNTLATTAPNGLNEASLLDNIGNTGVNYIFGSGGIALVIGTTYTYSIYIKQGTKPDFQITIDENGFGGKRYYSMFTYSTETVTSGITGGTNDGVVVGSTATKLPNGWYRLSLTFKTSTTNVSGFVDMINRFGNTSGSNYVWGRQLEYGSVATDYTPTTTTIINRVLSPSIQTNIVGTSYTRQNLLTYSQEFNDASWSKAEGTISANSISAPDETLTADTFIESITANAYHFFNKTITKSASSITYTLSTFVKSNGGRRIGIRLQSSGSNGSLSVFDLVSGTITTAAATYGTGFSNVSSTITSYSNSWYRITLTVTSDTATSLAAEYFLQDDATSTYTGNGTSGVYVWGAQLQVSSTATDYMKTTASAVTIPVVASTYFSSGFDENISITRLSQTGENLFLYSEQYNQSSWTNSGSTELINTTATLSPDGLYTADKLIGNNGEGTRQSIYQNVSVTSGVKYTFSVFLKQAERRYATIWFDSPSITEGAYYGATTYIDLQTGTIAIGTNTQIVAYPNGWYRCYVTATPSFTGNLSLNTAIGTPNNSLDGSGTLAYQYTGDGVSGIYVWGAQFERGLTPTDYIPTTTTTRSRSLPSPIFALSANVFPPYDPVYDDFGGTLFGPGQGRYMRQNTNKSVIVYNEIDEVTDFYGRGIIVRDGLILDLDAGITDSYPARNYYTTPQTLTNGRTGTTSGGNYTDFTSGGPDGGRFTRWTNDTGTSGSTAWHWNIDYSNSGLSVGQILTVSFYARCPNATLSNITINSPDSIAINANIDSTWRRYSGTIIYGGDYVSTPFIRINRSNTSTFTNGATYDIAKIQIENGASLTDFVDGTTWTDLSVYGTNGTLINMDTFNFNSANRGSLVFNGSDEYVDFNFVNPFSETVIVWVKSATSIWNSSGFISSSRRQNGHIIHPDGATSGVGFYIANSSGTLTYMGGVTPSNITVPQMYAYTTNGSNLHKGYLNGVEVVSSTTSITRTITPSSQPWLVGKDDTLNRHLNGNIYNVMRYNRALSAAEITQNYNAFKHRFGL